MATQAELQKVVDDTTALAAAARGAWKTAIPSEDAPKMTDDEQAVVDDLEAKFLAAKAARKAAELALREAVDAVAAADEKAKKDAEEAAAIAAAEAAAIAAAEAALAKKVAAEAGTPVGSKGLSVLDKKWILTVAGPKGLADPAFAAQVAGPRPKGWKG